MPAHVRTTLLLAFCASACHPAPPAATPSAPATPAPPAATASPSPAELGIDETALDTSVRACDDFYQYACGGWLARTPIPPEKSAWGRGFSTIYEHNEAENRTILEAAAKGQGTTQYADKLGALWTSCMDEAGIEKSGPPELQALLARVDAVKDVATLAPELAREHLEGVHSLFDIDEQQDFKDATEEIGVVSQGGLGLPDRDYYLSTTGKFPELRKQYEAHVARMLTLAGTPAAQATKDAATVMRLETALAQVSMPLVDQRDPQKVYHRLERTGLEKLTPKLNWKKYFGELGFPTLNKINVAMPDFFSGLDKLLAKTSPADLRTYLRWHVVHSAAPALPKAFVDENFAFFRHTLAGVAQIEPRWKRCVQGVDVMMGFALGEEFVKKTFGAGGKAQTQALVQEIESSMSRNLDALSWFDDATRAQAHAKLSHIANKIGYPDKWRDYSTLKIDNSSLLQNGLRAEVFEKKRQLTKVGQPVDRTEWGMTPPEVNAYYNPSMNEMVFPAGILQPPFFDKKASRPVNYGAIGMVMGHELTHGFDDEGRQFDAVGDLRDWWTPAVSKEFDRRAQCVADQFSGYVAVDDIHVNGKLTLGENIADLGGLKLAHAAYVAARGGAGPQTFGKWSDEQLFFLGMAQSWCTNMRPEVVRVLTATDVHSPPRYRVDGPLSNLPEFAAAFGCKAGDKMVRQNQCVVW